MRIAVFTAALIMSVSASLAADADGKIKGIDADKGTITLSDGKTYKLPGEFDVASLKEGMEIVISYDKVGNDNLIADMQVIE